MVEYEAPDDLSRRAVDLNALASEWAHREVDTQKLGDQWLDSMAEPLLIVPSVIMPLPNALDRNVPINHRHPDAPRIKTAQVVSFELHPKLFQP